jgi:hypothetical protein
MIWNLPLKNNGECMIWNLPSGNFIAVQPNAAVGKLMTLRHLQRINLSLRISSPKLDIYTTKVSK